MRLAALLLFVASCAPRTPVYVPPPERVVRNSLGLELVPVPPSGASTFAMGRHEITGAEFEIFVRETGYRTEAERSGGAMIWRGGAWVLQSGATYRNTGFGEDRPVTAVSYDDAEAFCAWLTEREGRAGLLARSEEYRLPTGAEWEEAARGGTRDTFAGTSDPEVLCEFGNVPDESAHDDGLARRVFPCDDDVGAGTAPVESYLPNAYGLFDMSGNVWEWVAPTDDGASPLREMRGGSFSGKLEGPRVEHKDLDQRTLRSGAVGFRVVRARR